MQVKLAKDLEKRFDAKIDNILQFKTNEHVNAFSFPATPVILDKSPKLISHLNWGLIPSWAQDHNIRKLTINARIETLNEKPAFRNSINNRCLVIANGFYEWKWLDESGKNKQKYLIALENQELFAFGGIYSEWLDKNSGEIRKTYSIVTTDANDTMAKIHKKKRMPVILKRMDEVAWLTGQDINSFALPYEVDLQATKIE